MSEEKFSSPPPSLPRPNTTSLCAAPSAPRTTPWRSANSRSTASRAMRRQSSASRVLPSRIASTVSRPSTSRQTRRVEPALRYRRSWVGQASGWAGSSTGSATGGGSATARCSSRAGCRRRVSMAKSLASATLATFAASAGSSSSCACCGDALRSEDSARAAMRSRNASPTTWSWGRSGSGVSIIGLWHALRGTLARCAVRGRLRIDGDASRHRLAGAGLAGIKKPACSELPAGLLPPPRRDAGPS